jgi:hypothetical protein
MDVYGFGPLPELSYLMHKELQRHEVYDARHWFFVVRLRGDLIEGSEAVIPKYEVRAPYRFRVIGILKGSDRVSFARMYDFVVLVGEPIEFVKENHASEVAQARASAMTFYR